MILTKKTLLKFLSKKRRRDSGEGDVTEAEFEKKRKSDGRKAWTSKANIDFIVNEIRGKNFRTYFGIERDQCDLDQKNLRRNVTKALEGQNGVSLLSRRDSLGSRNSQLSVEETPEEEIARLRAENRSLKEKFEPFTSLFQTQPGKQGASFTYGPVMDKLTISLLAEGESAESIIRFYKTLAREFPLLIDNDDHFEKRVPSDFYVRSLRDQIAPLNSGQLDHYLSGSSSLTLCVDDSPVMDNENVISISLANESGKMHCLVIDYSEAKTGDAIANEMIELVTKSGRGQEIFEKLKAIQSDLAPKQIKVIDQLTERKILILKF